jgi:hypothetical protein
MRAVDSVGEIGEPTTVSLSWILEHGMDRRFRDLYSGLAEARNDSIELTSFLSARLRNVLLRWHGLEWRHYLDATPTQLLARRNAGRKCLAEFLSIAEMAAAWPQVGQRGVARPEHPVGAAIESDRRNAGQADPEYDHIRDDLQTVIAWGSFERGGGDLAEILDRAWAEEQLPPEVAVPLARLRAADLVGWTRALAPRFDPWHPLRHFLADLSDGDRELLDRRLCSLTGAETLGRIGDRRNITRERVRQIETKLAGRLRKLASTPGSSLGRAVTRVRLELGVAVQTGHLAMVEALTELGVTSIETLEARTLLWLAGPYQLGGDWLVRRPAQQVLDGSRQLLDRLTSSGPAAISDAEDGLEAFGVARTEARDWIISMGGYRIHDDVLVRWRGSMADKAEVILRLAGDPLSQDDLVSRLGPQTNQRSMVNQLLGDPRFKRTGLRQFGLASWDHDEYTGIADEIAQEIERQGGEASLTHLIATISSTYAVSPSSVRAYALGPQFEKGTGGSIRLRTVAGQADPSPLPESTRGAFLIGDVWSYRMRVSDQHLRGSGSVLPAPVARMFGLRPLDTVDLTSKWGAIRLSWPSLSPHLGSIRVALQAFGAYEGDLVFLIVRDTSADLMHVPRVRLNRLQGPARLAAEVGGDPTADNFLQTVARSLAMGPDSTSTAIRRRLLARGEDELASLIPQEPDDESLVLSLRSARFVEVRMSR